MSVIAFDAASTTGWAYRRPPQGSCGCHCVGLGVWTTDILDPWDHRAVDKLLQSAKCHGVTRAVIEDCYLGVNPQTYKILAVVQGLLRSACDRAELPVEVIPASTWHADLKLTGKRADRKRGAMMIATKVLRALPDTQDAADAVCLCDFAERSGVRNGNTT